MTKIGVVEFSVAQFCLRDFIGLAMTFLPNCYCLFKWFSFSKFHCYAKMIELEFIDRHMSWLLFELV